MDKALLALGILGAALFFFPIEAISRWLRELWLTWQEHEHQEGLSRNSAMIGK
jgi:hypothetical protein